MAAGYAATAGISPGCVWEGSGPRPDSTAVAPASIIAPWRGGGWPDAKYAGARVAARRGRQGRPRRLRTALRRDPGETVWRHHTYLAPTGSCRRGDAGDLSQDLEQRRTVRSCAVVADHMDGRDRPQPSDRSHSQEDRSVDRRGRCRAGSRRRYPRSARQARDDRGAAAAPRLHGAARRGAPPAGAVRLLRRLEPRAARRQVRQAGEHHQDLAAPRAHGNPGVPRVMTDDADTPEMLAAEYVLGTLGTDERQQAEALLARDSAFARLVHDWERRLGELHAMVQP